MFRKVYLRLMTFLAVLCAVAFSLWVSSDTSAYTAEQVQKSIMNKAVYQGLYHCYNDGYIKPDFGAISQYMTISNLLTDKGQNESDDSINLVTGATSDSVWARSAGYSVADSGLKCSELLSGGFYFWGGSNSGILEVMGKSKPNNTSSDEVKAFFENMGYKVDVPSGTCYKVGFSYDTIGLAKTSGNGETNSVCLENGQLSVESRNVNDMAFFDVKNGNEVCLWLRDGLYAKERTCRTLENAGEAWGSNTGVRGFGENFLNSIISDACLSKDGAMVCETSGSLGAESYAFKFNPAGSVTSFNADNAVAKFVGNNGDMAAMRAIQYLSGNDKYLNKSDTALKPLEERVLDQLYLTEYYGVVVDCAAGEGAYANGNNTINWYDISSNSMKTCVYTTNNAKNESMPVNGVSNGYFVRNKYGNMQGVLDAVKGMPVTYTDEEIADFTENVQDGIDMQTAAGDSDICYSGAGPIGWIICPIVAGVSQVGNYMWGQIEQDFMQIPTEFFSGDNGVRTAWETVRNIGNIVFIILFLAVIISQLTGWGIDNYGIKKILPRLIIVAVVMNLSFIVCELAADLSNILGASLGSTLSGFANEIVKPENSPIAAGVGGIAITGFLGSGGVALFTLLNPLTAAEAAASVGLAALGVAISMVIAILTLYLILIIREVGVILCIVLAPVAIVCYALPNTERLYKRWFDVFKAVLVVYPICGALVGAGQFAGAILASISGDGGVGLKIAAMLVQVLPFFLIPTLLRSSLAGLGNIGARVSTMGRNFGRRASGTAQGAIRGSERFKDFQGYQNQQAIVRRAQRVHDRLSNRTNLTAREQDRLRKADEALLAQRRRVSENATRTSGEYFAAMQAKQDLETDNETAMVNQYNDENYQRARRISLDDTMQRQRSRDLTTLANAETRGMGLEQLRGAWNDAFDRGDTDRLDALTNVMTSRYGTSAANVIGQELSGKRGIAGNENYQRSMQALQRTMLENSSFSNNMKNKASDAFQMISDGGMRFDRPSNAMVYEDLGYFSEHNATSSDIKDWSTQSAATLQRAIDSGALSDEMIENILNSTDPSVRSGIQSDVSKRDVLQARLQGYRGDWNNRSLVAQAAREYRSTHLGQQEIAQQMQEQMANDLSQINEQLHQHGTGGESFDGGAGI